MRKIASDTVEKENNFIAVEVDSKKGKLVKRRIAPSNGNKSVPRGPGVGLLDPFGTLPGYPERLRSLIRQGRC